MVKQRNTFIFRSRRVSITGSQESTSSPESKECIIHSGVGQNGKNENICDFVMAVNWKSCMCLGPKTASLLIATYYIIVSIAVIILACIGYNVLTPINMLKTEKGQKEASEGDEVLLEGITSAKILLIVLIATSIISAFTSIMMVYAITQGKSHWIYIWINAHVFVLGADILVCFCNMFLELPDELQKTCAIYGTVTNIMLTLYFLVVVNNFYSDMVDKIPMGFYVDNPYFFFKSKGNRRFLE